MPTPTFRRLWALPLVLLLASFAPRQARGQGGDELRRGIEAYENFEYPEAQKLLEQAVGRTDLTPSDRARAQLHLGLVRFTLGDRVAAEAAFKAALEIERQLSLPADTSPKISEVFEAVRARLPRLPEPKPKPEPKPEPRPEPRPKPGPGVGGPAPPPVEEQGRVWTWVLAGVGGAALVAGGTCGYLAYSSEQDFKNATWASEAQGFKEDAETRALAANVLYGLGGAALAAALVLFFFELDDAPSSDAPAGGESADVGIRFSPAPGGAVLRW